MRRQRERDTGLLLEETHGKQIQMDQMDFRSVYLWKNYTSKEVSPKRWQLRTKGAESHTRELAGGLNGRGNNDMAAGQKVLPRLCAGNRTEQLKLAPSEPEARALPAVTGSVDPALGPHYQSLTGSVRSSDIPLTYILRRSHPGSSQRIHRTREGSSMSSGSFHHWHLTTAVIKAARDRWLN